MSDLWIGILSFPALLALIFLRIPIGLAMFGVGFLGLYAVQGDASLALGRLRSESYTTFSNYALSIIPMFLLMGHFATLGGMSRALFDAAASFLGHRRGGVAMAAIGACAGFGAICGSSLATAATMGRVALPELRAKGYSGGLATATLAAGGTLGILIPPSIVLVIYAILTEQNIAKLFAAALIPGVLAALGYMAAIAIYMRRHPQEARLSPRAPWAMRARALRATWPVLAVFLVVVGGIYGGIFTPTEGAAIGALGAGGVAWAQGGLTRETLAQSLLQTASSTAMIFFIILGAAYFNGFLALTQVPQGLAEWVGGLGWNPYVILLLILCLYLLFGCVMDSLSMILLTIPIFFPVILSLDFGLLDFTSLQLEAVAEVLRGDLSGFAADQLAEARAAFDAGLPLAQDTARALGINLTEARVARMEAELVAIWFGILVLIVVETGLITPPVGMNLFVISAMDRDTPVSATYRAVLYFVTSDLLRVALLVAFPAITLIWLI